MIQTIQFPNQYDVIREEAARFNRLTSDRKFEMIESLIQTGLGFIDISPVKEHAAALRDQAFE